MRKRQSHWLALTYYHPCFDFSESIRVNADNLINIHEPSSSIILRAFYIVIISSRIRSSFVILSVLFVVFFFLFFIETLNDKQYLKHHHQSSSVNMTNMHSYMVILITKFLSSYNAKI